MSKNMFYDRGNSKRSPLTARAFLFIDGNASAERWKHFRLLTEAFGSGERSVSECVAQLHTLAIE